MTNASSRRLSAPRPTAPTRRGRRARTLAAALALGAALLGGCSSEGADVTCNLDNCTATFDRGVEAKASVLGVDVQLVGVQNDQVKLKVGDQEISVPAGGQGQTEAGGLRIQVQEVTDSKVTLKISKGG
jgi:hypothetical protein